MHMKLWKFCVNGKVGGESQILFAIHCGVLTPPLKYIVYKYMLSSVYQ